MSDRPEPQQPQQRAFENVNVGGNFTMGDLTQNITLHEGRKVSLIYSDPVPNLRFFQGREAELASLNGWLSNPSVSIIGVRGEGGIGKSTLAAKAFAECLGFVGKFWADVRTGTSMTELAERALKEFGVPPEEVKAIEEKNLIPSLLRRLQMERYLLAIDNLETVLTSTGEWKSGYESFLEGIQDYGGESVLLLASREYPSRYFGWRRSQWLTVEQGLGAGEGAALLAAQEVEDTLENRVTLSEQVQGNPLALSLIAGWIRETYRPGARLVNHLTKHANLFQLEGRHRGEQQVSIDRVMEWSLDRLTQEQQYLLSQVSMFRGGFNAEAATTVVAPPEGAIQDSDLDDLERRSLLQLLPQQDKYGRRVFQLQPRVREFIQKRTDDLTATCERAIAYFWHHRQTELPKDGVLEDIAEYEETFYYQCHIGRYSDATATVLACDSFLRRRGYYSTLVDLYSQLYQDWQASLEQRQTYAAICGNLGNTYYSLGQYKQTISLYKQSLEIAREIGDRQGEAMSLGNLGSVYDSLGQYERAISLHQKSLEIKRETGDRQGESVSLGNLGSAYLALGQYERAISLHQQSLEIAHEIGDRQGEAAFLGNLGNAYNSLGQYEQAISLYQQSLKTAREVGDRKGEAASLGNLGTTYHALGQYERAISLHQQSLETARAIEDRKGEAAFLGNLGNAHYYLGQYERAISLHQQSLKIKREIGDRKGEAASLGNLGSAYDSLGQYERAISLHQQQLEIAREIGDRQGEANSLGNLGNAHYALGQYERAVSLYQQSLEIKREIGDRKGEAASLGNLGSVYDSLGQYERAISLHQQSLKIKREIGDRQGEAMSLGNLGNAHYALGQYEQAISLHQQSLEIAREIGDRKGEAASLGNLGSVYDSLGQYERAISLHQQSLEIKREIGDRQGEATSLGNLGLAYYALEQHERAISLHQQSLEIKREIGDRQGEATSLGNLGLAYDALGKCERAISLHQQSLEIKREIGDRKGEATSLRNLGTAYYSLGQYEQAISLHQQSLKIKREIGDRWGEGASLLHMGNALARLNRHYEALQSYQQALAIYEDLKLDRMVEQCKTAISERNRIIALQRQTVPTIGNRQQELDAWWEKSLPASPQRASPGTNSSQQWWIWFLVGLVLVLLIWLL